MSSLDSGRSASASLPPASLDRRFYAFVLDRAIAWGLDAVAAVVAWQVWFDHGETWPGVALIAGTVLLVGLAFAVVAGTTGTSPGKAIFGLRLVDHDHGTPVGVGRAVLRTLILGVAGLPTFGLGVATLAQTALTDPGRQRRGWHDQVTHGVVVDLRPAPELEEIVVERPHQIVNLTAMRLAPVSAAPAPVPARVPVARPEPRPAPRTPEHAAEPRTEVPALPKPRAAGLQVKQDGLLQKLEVATDAAAPTLQIIATRPAGNAPRVLKGGLAGAAVQPIPEAFATAASWALKLPQQLSAKDEDVLLELDFVGDIGRVFSGTTMLDDWYYNGQRWQIGLKQFALKPGAELKLNVLPLRADAPIYIDAAHRPTFAQGQTQVAELRGARLLPVRRAAITP